MLYYLQVPCQTTPFTEKKLQIILTYRYHYLSYTTTSSVPKIIKKPQIFLSVANMKHEKQTDTNLNP